MIYTINLVQKDRDGVVTKTDLTSNVEIGFSILEKLDESLDVGSLVITPITQSEPFTLFDTIEIVIDGVIKFSQRISSDTVELVSKKDGLYKHTIQLVEHTKVLETITISGFTLTQPLEGTKKTIYDAIENLRLTYPLGSNVKSRLFVIPTATQDVLDSFETSEFTLKDITLKDAINKILDQIDSISRLVRNDTTGNLELVLETYNELKELITDESTFLNKGRHINSDLYATELTSDLLNVVSDSEEDDDVEVYPSETGFISARSTGFFISDSNSAFITPKPIYEPVKFEWRGDITVTDGATPIFDGFVTLDLTDRLFESELYKILKTDKQEKTVEIITDLFVDERKNPDKFFKANTLEYTYKGNEIDLGRTTGIWDSTPQLDFVIKLAMQQYIFDNNLVNTNDKWYRNVVDIDINSTWDDYGYRMTYKPIPTSYRFSMSREDNTYVDKYSELLANQQSRVVNLNRISENIYGKINRIGNLELEISERVNDLDDAYNIGDYTDDFFIITNRELIFYKDYINVNYSLTKNFNKISQFIGVNSEIRQWEIGEKGRTLERDLLFKEFVEIDAVSSGSGSNNSHMLTTLGVERYLDTFTTTVQPKAKVGAIIPRKTNPIEPVLTSIEYGNQDITVSSILNPMTITGASKSLFFNWQFDSNKSAGYRMNFLDESAGTSDTLKQYALDFVPYTDDIGELFDITFIVGEDYNPASLDYIKHIPALGGQPSNQLLDFSLPIYKDSRQILGGSFQIQNKSKDYQKVIVGNALSKKNNLVFESGTTRTFKLYTFNTQKYNPKDVKKIVANGVEGVDYDVVSIVPTVDKVNHKITVSHANLTSSKSAWALTTGGDLLLAVNQDGTLLNVITFDFNIEDSKVNYKY